MSTNKFFGFILSHLSGHSIDRLVSGLDQTIHALQTAEAKLNARANQHYDKSAYHDSQGDKATREAYRAGRVSKKLRDLVE